MAKQKIDIGKYTSFAMEGLVMDAKAEQTYKMVADFYMTVHDRAIENGANEDEAHKIATNIITATYRSQA
ncbi:hypothetical protein SILAB01_02284 [Lacticaseibacillus paracasei]|uniref:hypothetical protein n=1 Tax=Lacticaseibacillus paracasei TaxID=1597 RepID=UPI000917D95A|nr:hypothetical protein [Lacticaseibacillus paracasei]GAV18388.1 hypothetical protein SILAB01_02284 [Lacticaseibacillus paracasei]